MELAANQASLSVATLTGKCMAFAFGSSVILGRYPLSDDDGPNPLNSVVIEDGQLVRGVTFLRIPDGPLCLVTAGDGKYINVYNISSWKGNNPDAFNISSSSDDDDGAAGKGTPAKKQRAERPRATVNDVEAKKWVPSYRYGPHNKRITHVVATNEGSIVFADKFGEVYRLHLTWSPEHKIEVEGDAKNPVEFILQHFSILSKVFVSSPVPRLDPISRTQTKDTLACRRLFTCDRDRHARVSRYPEAYQVEQYLWTKSNEQSVVTCVAEVPYLDDEDANTPASAPAIAQNPRLTAPYSYYVTGYQDGHIDFWAAHNDLPMDSPLESFHSFRSHKPEGDYGAVVSVVYLAQDLDAAGNPRHPRDIPRGVLVAYERCKEMFFHPLFDGVGQFGMHAAQVGGTSITLPDFPAAVIKCNEKTAMAILRSGEVCLVHLVEVPGPDAATAAAGERPKLCSFNANIHVAIQPMSIKMPYLQEKIESVIGKGEGNKLRDLDLSAQWRSEFGDNRPRQDEKSGEDSDNDGEDADGKKAGKDEAGKSPDKKRARTSKK